MRSSSSRTLEVLSRWIGESSAVCALAPVLILIGIQFGATIVICSSLATASYATSKMGNSRLERNLLAVTITATVLSIAGFIMGLTGSLALALISTFAVSAVVLLTAQLRRSMAPEPSVLRVAPRIKTPHFMIAFTITLSLMGWTSLYWFLAGLLTAEVLKRVIVARIAKLLSFVSVCLGFAASLSQLQHHSGQFWLSFDQLYRSALAAGLSKWGFGDHIGATGTTLRYHWLGESVAGFVSWLPSVSAIESVTRITPALGVLVCLSVLIQLGIFLGFTPTTAMIAASGTIVLGKVFEIYSVGSLWGIGLYLIGVLFLLVLQKSIREGYDKRLLSMPTVVILTLLISMSQVTLGVHYLLLTAASLGWSSMRLRRRRLTTLTTVSVQFVALAILNQTLLSSTAEHIYAPSVSLSNVMQFRGIDIYQGNHWLFVMGSSALYLMVISQKLGGLIFVSLKSKMDRIALGWFGIVALVSLLLANAFSIGGPEAQQNRFLVPMVTFGSFLSLSMSFRELARALRITEFRVSPWRLTVAVSLSATVATLYIKLHANNLPWSYMRTLLVAVSIGVSQILLLVVITLYANRHRLLGNWVPRLAVFLIPLIAVTSDTGQIQHAYNLQTIGAGTTRTEPFLGGAEVQQCMRVVQQNSTSESIIASNWYSVPLATRDNKYFFVSATSERRTYLDGPNYVANPAPEWLAKRLRVVETFAENADFSSYEVLMAAKVSLFLVDRSSPVPSSWEPYARVLFQNHRCTVLQLRP